MACLTEIMGSRRQPHIFSPLIYFTLVFLWNLESTRGYHMPSDKDVKAWGGIRIYPVYADTFELHAFAKELKEIAIEPALKIWQSALRPKHRPPGNRILPRECVLNSGSVTPEGDLVCEYWCLLAWSCFDHMLPENVLQGCKVHEFGSINTESEDGADVGKFDMIITFHTASITTCLGSEAQAASCKVSAYDNRPIVGDVNICPGAWPRGRPDNYTRDVIIHEIGHILGFSQTSYAYFLDDTGRPRTKRLPDGTPDTLMIYNFHIPSEDVIRMVVSRGGSASGFYKTKQFIAALPSVKEEARKHFNCTKLKGVPMEYDTRFSGFGAHFETRSMQGDIMSAAPSADAVITPISLAFLKDTGWYYVNKSVAQPMKWAKNAGCDFIRKPCAQLIESRKAANLPLEPFCESVGSRIPSCMASGRYYGYCFGTVSGRLISEWKENSENATADTVNIQKPDGEFEKCFLRITMPRFTGIRRVSDDCQADVKIPYPAHKNRALESFGPESVCVDHERLGEWKNTNAIYRKPLQRYGASCHQRTCSQERGLELLFGEQTVVCPLDGGVIPIHVKSSDGNLMGYIRCKPCVEYCDVCGS